MAPTYNNNSGQPQGRAILREASEEIRDQHRLLGPYESSRDGNGRAHLAHRPNPRWTRGLLYDNWCSQGLSLALGLYFFVMLRTSLGGDETHVLPPTLYGAESRALNHPKAYDSGPPRQHDSTVPAAEPDTETKDSALPAYDPGRLTAIFAHSGLVIAWLAGIACIASGASTFAEPSFVSVTDQGFTFAEPLPPGFAVIRDGNGVWALLATGLLTVITEATGFVHNVCLRWNLWSEGRLVWTTSLRLITTSRASVSTSMAANLLYFVTLGLAFTASSQIFVAALFYPGRTVTDEINDGTGTRWTESLSVANGAALMTLGVCLVVQAALVTWMYVAARHRIKTWSSSPLTVALACATLGRGEPGSRYSTMTSAAMRLPKSRQYIASSSAIALKPKHKQESLVSTRRKGVATVLGSLILLLVLIVVWAGIVVNAYAGAGLAISGAELSDDNTKIAQVAGSSAWQKAPAIQMFYWQQNGQTSPPPMSTSTTMFVCLLLVFVMQALLTFALHTVELLCNTFRDQRRWERATKHVRRHKWNWSKGAALDPNGLVVFFTSIPNIILLAAKVLAHWLFNRCLLPLLFFSDSVLASDGSDGWQTSETQIQLFGVPTLVLAGVVFLLLVLAWFLANHRPDTPQPATYGHIPTQRDVVDDWGGGDVIFWGDKGLSKDGIHRHAGTAGQADDLGQIQYGSEYL